MQANTGKLYQPLSAIPKAMERAYCSLVSPLHVADLHCLVCWFFFLQLSSMLMIIVSKFLLQVLVCKRTDLYKPKICEF